MTSPQREDEMYVSAQESINYEQSEFPYEQKTKESFSNMFADTGNIRSEDVEQYNASTFDQTDCRDSYEDSDEEEINVTWNILI